VIDQNDARQALEKVVADLRTLSYADLRERVTEEWPWVMRKGLVPSTARRVLKLSDKLRGRRERLFFVSSGEPDEHEVTGPSGVTYHVLVDFSWANREEDVEVTAWVHDEESQAEHVEVAESFVVPRGR
jgi:hypothetical protein